MEMLAESLRPFVDKVQIRSVDIDDDEDHESIPF